MQISPPWTSSSHNSQLNKNMKLAILTTLVASASAFAPSTSKMSKQSLLLCIIIVQSQNPDIMLFESKIAS